MLSVTCWAKKCQEENGLERHKSSFSYDSLNINTYCTSYRWIISTWFTIKLWYMGEVNCFKWRSYRLPIW